MSGLILTPRLAHEVEAALNRNEYTVAEVHSLCRGDTLKRIRDSVLGQSAFNMLEINCDADPFIPDGYRVEEHRRGGRFIWDASKVAFWNVGFDQGRRWPGSHDIRRDMASRSVLNANVLDHLLGQPRLIPEEWKARRLFFWGTIYRNSFGSACVRYLCWDLGRWSWRPSEWLGTFWREPCTVAVHMP